MPIGCIVRNREHGSKYAPTEEISSGRIREGAKVNVLPLAGLVPAAAVNPILVILCMVNSFESNDRYVCASFMSWVERVCYIGEMWSLRFSNFRTISRNPNKLLKVQFSLTTARFV